MLESTNPTGNTQETSVPSPSDALHLENETAAVHDSVNSPDLGSENDAGLQSGEGSEGLTEDRMRGDGHGMTLDEVLSRIPDAAAERLTTRDIEALAAGDPEAVTRIMHGGGDAGADDEEGAHDHGPALEQVRGIERISLRGLSVQDQRAVAEMIQAVKQGHFANLAEAQAAMFSGDEGQDDGVDADSDSEGSDDAVAYYQDEPSVDEVGQAMANLQAHISQLETEQQEAAQQYDTVNLVRLNNELLEAKLQLRDAEVIRAQQQAWAEHYAAREQACLEAVHSQYAEEMESPVFMRALSDAHDLAQYRHDPVLESPDWPIHLAHRVMGSLQTHHESHADNRRSAAGTRFPQAPASGGRVRGALEGPASNGTSMMSVTEALAALDGMDESQVDAVLHGIRQRERAARRL